MLSLEGIEFSEQENRLTDHHYDCKSLEKQEGNKEEVISNEDQT